MYNSLQNYLEPQQQRRYQNVTLPEMIYDYVYAGREPVPVPLRDVKGYIYQIQQELDKFQEEYEVIITNTNKTVLTASTNFIQ